MGEQPNSSFPWSLSLTLHYTTARAANRPRHRQKSGVRNGSLDGSPVRGPAGQEPILFTLPFESSRLNGRKSRSGKVRARLLPPPPHQQTKLEVLF